ncbi:MFS transporter [Anabaena cylindrica FACHB-243]|uniref:Major facilitator superfamily MFS_1 n=1 Tax=Anabaena cylindrica (strain ATCC 27899 / PCC 7122) TaxID=272123 RepID=K9ZDK8_ANACC|nr:MULTISPECIES: MFS transporter [Anabaena]AFZ56824.1 major facilitator superfamily MFS_1 [Anabaena cylindrica PCC 7122]MBD2418966.1 MFS transporter [Anabaena cylindrica FACHB-243]MBY5285108.1 MFS transporter [Anabaena sp. CCAP 1446/1C]MBY5308840.1 MFS transporter [Anabaena sp. CCAP 1446/1C]MCM2409501.1 MFS transporter [Anabaena sp. CCAP 1446/1C]
MQNLSSTKSSSPFSTGLPALYIIALLSGTSLGLFNPFISTLMAQYQVSDLWIGANSTVYFLMIALGTPLVAKILHRIGLRKTMMLGLILMGISAPLFPWTTQLSLWFVIRIIMGFGCCLYLVCGQTALNYFCHDSNRAITNGLYALAFSLGFGIGPVIGSSLYNISPKLTFSLGSLLIICGIVAVSLGLPEKPVVFQATARIKLMKKLKLPLQSAFAYGFTEATLVSLYPVYLLQQNYSVEQIGLTFAVFVFGGLIATVPITHLADRFGRLKILLATMCVALLSILSLGIVTNNITIQILTFIIGASVSPILPLSIAMMGDELSRNELSSGSALLTTIYSFGCTLGPILSSLIMQIFGRNQVFILSATTFIIIASYIIRELHKLERAY